MAAMVAAPREPEAREVYQYWVVQGIENPQADLVFREVLSPADRDVPRCHLFDVAIGTDLLAFTVRFYDYEATGHFIERAWVSVLRAEAPDLRGTLREVHRLEGGELDASLMRVSPTHVATLYDWATLRVFGDDGAVLQPTYGLEEFLGLKSNLEIMGDADVLWEQFRDPTVLVGSRNGAPPTVLRSVDGGETVRRDIRSTTADGNAVAWLEARDWDAASRRYASVQLWTAEYRDGELVSPRHVGDVDGHEDGTLGAGYYVHPEPDPIDDTRARFAFYRLSDGARAVVDPSPLPANFVLYVSEDAAIVESLGQKFWIDPRTLTFEAP